MKSYRVDGVDLNSLGCGCTLRSFAALQHALTKPPSPSPTRSLFLSQKTLQQHKGMLWRQSTLLFFSLAGHLFPHRSKTAAAGVAGLSTLGTVPKQRRPPSHRLKPSHRTPRPVQRCLGMLGWKHSTKQRKPTRSRCRRAPLQQRRPPSQRL